MGSTVLALLALSTVDAARAMVVARDAATALWQPIRRAEPDAPITVHFGLAYPADHARRIEETALQIADPTNSRFRQHLRPDELVALTSHSEMDDAAERVQSWLDGCGVESRLRGGVIDATMMISEAEDLLNTTYHVFSDGTFELIRTAAYSVPHHLEDLLSFVTPTVHFPAARRTARKRELHRKALTEAKQTLRKRDDDPCGDGSAIDPACIAQTYNVTYTAKPNRTTFAVYATEAASYSASDLSTFLQYYNTAASEAKATYQVIGDGFTADGDSGIGSTFETALDTQTLLGTAFPASGILYNLGGVFGPSNDSYTTFDPFVTFLQDLIHNETVPSVVSFSESTSEDVMDPAYAQTLCNLMAQVGMRGVSLFFSSGDNGPQGDQPTGTHSMPFEPEFPASCPYVTAVGGTTNPANETAATGSTMSFTSKLGYYASGGGFSNLFSTPSYQSSVVPSYISNSVPASYHSIKGFNASGRGIPDVSALSTNIAVVVDDITIPIGGTSASTPLWASLITLLNDYEASQGHPPLGFLNPWLYSLAAQGATPAPIKDITTGGNNAGECWLITGCLLDQTLGYDVTEGWDPVTGLGSPNFAALLAALG